MKTKKQSDRTADGPPKGPSALAKKLAKQKLKAALPILRQLIGAEAEIAYEELTLLTAEHLDSVGAKAIEAEAENTNCNPEILAGAWLKQRILGLEKLSAKTRQKRKSSEQLVQCGFGNLNSNKGDSES